MTQQTRWSQFLVLITVFFFWGFVAASNDILIPVFKNAFHLTQAQSQYVAVAFYVAYTVGSLIYFFTSRPTRSSCRTSTSSSRARASRRRPISSSPIGSTPG